MIQTIGLVVCAYVLTRCVEIATTAQTAKPAKVLAILCAGFTVLSAVALVLSPGMQ